MALAFITGYDFSTATRIKREGSMSPGRTEGGKYRFVRQLTTLYHSIDAVVPGLNVTRRETLMDWLETNEPTEIDLVISGETYRGYLDPARPGAYRNNSQSTTLYDVSFSFKGVKQ